MSKIDLNEMFEISSGYKGKKDTQIKETIESFSTGRLEDAFYESKDPIESCVTVEKTSSEVDGKSRNSLLDRVFKGKKNEAKASAYIGQELVDNEECFTQTFPQEKSKIVEKSCERIVLPSADDYKTSVLEEAQVVSSFYLESNEGKVIDISKNYFLIGCGSECDFVIETDPVKHTISRKHAYIIIKNDTAFLKDMSSNGTFIGDSLSKDFYRIPKDTEVEVRVGQFIKFSDKLFSFHRR